MEGRLAPHDQQTDVGNTGHTDPLSFPLSPLMPSSPVTDALLHHRQARLWETPQLSVTDNDGHAAAATPPSSAMNSGPSLILPHLFDRHEKHSREVAHRHQRVDQLKCIGLGTRPRCRQIGTSCELREMPWSRWEGTESEQRQAEDLPSRISICPAIRNR
jgi:hypothetical protein